MDKNREEITKHISYKLQFIDSARFMASSLSNLVNNLFEGIHRNVKTVELNISIATVEYTNFINDLIVYKCLYNKKIIITSLTKS